MTDNKLNDESKDHSYFTIIPQIVWTKVDSPFEFTLWHTIKMIAGDSGECWLSTRDLATASMMSKSQVQRCRDTLIDKGLIIGELYRDPGHDNAVWHLQVPDLWAENVAWRLANPSLKDRIRAKEEGVPGEDRVSLVGTGGVSLVGTGVSLVGTGCPCGTTEEEPSRRTKKEEPHPAGEPPGGEPLGEEPLGEEPTVVFYDFQFEGMPVLEVYEGDTQYSCPWSDCKEGKHPLPSKTRAYTTPCGHPLGFYRNGQVWIKPKRPAASKEKPRQLQYLVDLGKYKAMPYANLPYGRVGVRFIQIWDDPAGQLELHSALIWAMTTGIPPHEKVEKAIVRAENTLRAQGLLNRILQGTQSQGVHRERTEPDTIRSQQVQAERIDSGRHSNIPEGL